MGHTEVIAIHCFTALFVLSSSAILYIYLGYPATLWLLAMFKREGSHSTSPAQVEVGEHQGPTSIAVVIPAHNEEIVIEEKLKNHLALDTHGLIVTFYVLADNCVDRTEELVKGIASVNADKIELISVTQGRGKTNAINTLMPSITQDITVFTDANVFLKSDALQQIAKALNQAGVGGVAGQLSYTNINENQASESTGLYWRYEEWIKSMESNLDSIMGADGSIFAIKTMHFKKLPTHVLDDFCTSMGVVLSGQRFVFDTDIKAYERTTNNFTEEFSRKIRIANRSYDSFTYLKQRDWSQMSVRQLWMFYSHKVIRWHTTVFILLAVLSTAVLFVLQPDNALWPMLLALQALTALLVSVEVKLPRFLSPINKITSTLKYFLLANIATAIGVFRSMTGKSIETWQSSESSRTE